MIIAVTGASGLVGQKLCKKLIESGHEVIAIGRGPEEKFRLKFTFPCSYQTWDELDLKSAEAVVHLAGESIASGRWTKSKKASILASRTETTIKLIQAFEKSKYPEVFIGASAIGYYGHQDDRTLTEDSPASTGFLSEVCQKWEKPYEKISQHCRQVTLRIGVVFDQNGGFLKPMEELFSLGFGGKVGNGKQWLSWIHSEDLCNMIMHSLDKPISGIYNAVSPSPMTNKEWTQIFAKQMGVAAFLPAPKLALKVVLGEMSILALGSQKVMCEKIQATGFKFKFPNPKLALEDIYSWKKKVNERLFFSHQWINRKPEDVFPFFSEAKNLEKITPPWLNFKILKQSTPKIGQGTLIDYRIALKGFPMRWRTEIINWSPPQAFTDNQLKGPYRKWHHTHTFKSYGTGTSMEDHVVYQVPLWRLGQLLLGFYIKNDVRKIFQYRTQSINTIFSD